MRLISVDERVEHLEHLAHLEHLEHLAHLDVVIDGSKSVVTSRRSREHLEKGRFDEQRHQDVQDVKMLNFSTCARPNAREKDGRATRL
jgi:demethoxyubiquinone hydroxylase (CLK1/Coq7/Cat5 family)